MPPRLDIGEATRGALSVQRLSTRVLVALVALCLLTSVLIVWLYVGRNILRRLTALNDGMLAIAGGKLHTPVAAEGVDEIAAMGQAVEIFRKNTLERDELLAEKAQAAERLEKEVEERTAELAQSVAELRALGEVSQAVNSTINLGDCAVHDRRQGGAAFRDPGWDDLCSRRAEPGIPAALNLRYGRSIDRGH